MVPLDLVITVDTRVALLQASWGADLDPFAYTPPRLTLVRDRDDSPW